jgi:hypothetical protein
VAVAEGQLDAAEIEKVLHLVPVQTPPHPGRP